jgi:eukaryotic-like serine/threonine-protein kinase
MADAHDERVRGPLAPVDTVAEIASLRPGSRVGPYELLGFIGAGGMGEVYRARDPRLRRNVAVKLLRSDVATDPDRLRRFEREAHAVAALNHPNILASGRPIS